MRNLLFVVLAFAAAPAAIAQPTSAYYGVALGTFDYTQEDNFGSELIADSPSSYRLMVGYQFSKHLAVEGGWGKTGTISATFELPPLDTLEFRSEFQILTVRLLGVLPFDNGVTLLGGIGYADMKQKVTLTSGTDSSSGSQTGSEPALYVAAQYDWERFAVRLGYEKYNFSGNVYVAETSIGFFYKL